MGSEDSSDSFRMREKPCEWIKINHDKTNGDKIMADLRLGWEVISTGSSYYNEWLRFQDTTPEGLGGHRSNLTDL